MSPDHGAQSVDNGSRFPYHSAIVPPSSSGLGRGPFKAEIVGSNPIGGTRARLSVFTFAATFCSFSATFCSFAATKETDGKRERDTDLLAPSFFCLGRHAVHTFGSRSSVSPTHQPQDTHCPVYLDVSGSSLKCLPRISSSTARVRTRRWPAPGSGTFRLISRARSSIACQS